ncbi:unnamed protein product [Penicillium salamii]|nr:unnamed protein product [Penicillium salamii]CAG8274959.1 unnamed protein product [Penicillium salamii]CAG8364068.1 unnamed protein product [Penicillium salamii]
MTCIEVLCLLTVTTRPPLDGQKVPFLQESIPMQALPASTQKKSEKQHIQSTPVDDSGQGI